MSPSSTSVANLRSHLYKSTYTVNQMFLHLNVVSYFILALRCIFIQNGFVIRTKSRPQKFVFFRIMLLSHWIQTQIADIFQSDKK